MVGRQATPPPPPFEAIQIIKTWNAAASEAQKAALDKIADIACKYDKVSPGRRGAIASPSTRRVMWVTFDRVIEKQVKDGDFVHQCFGGGGMEPELFRKQLNTAFKVKLTDEELKELVGVFDKAGTGVISAADFLNSFYELGA
jgi:Ca2+-binding EF-hand superfamily protein